MMKTQTMTVMEFLMRRKMKTGLIQKILIQMGMVSMTVRRRKTELILMIPILMVTE